MMYLLRKDIIRGLFFSLQNQVRPVGLVLEKWGLLSSYLGSKPNFVNTFFGFFPDGMNVVCSGEPGER